MPSKKILGTHKSYLKDPQMMRLDQLQMGHVVKFIYDNEERTAFVLNPNADGKVHALSLKSIDRKTFLKEVVSKLNEWGWETPQMFYESFLKNNSKMVKYSYRTYFRNKMSKIHKFDYELKKKQIL